MLWCSHCRTLVPPRRDDDYFTSCSGCGKVLLYQDCEKDHERKSRRASSTVKLVSGDDSESSKIRFKRAGLMSKQAVDANPAEMSAEAPVLKKHAPISKKKSEAITKPESGITENDFKSRHGYENFNGGRDGGSSASYKSDVVNQEHAYDDYSYDGDVNDGDY